MQAYRVSEILLRRSLGSYLHKNAFNSFASSYLTPLSFTASTTPIRKLKTFRWRLGGLRHVWGSPAEVLGVAVYVAARVIPLIAVRVGVVELRQVNTALMVTKRVNAVLVFILHVPSESAVLVGSLQRPKSRVAVHLFEEGQILLDVAFEILGSLIAWFFTHESVLPHKKPSGIKNPATQSGGVTSPFKCTFFPPAE